MGEQSWCNIDHRAGGNNKYKGWGYGVVVTTTITGDMVPSPKNLLQKVNTRHTKKNLPVKNGRFF